MKNSLKILIMLLIVFSMIFVSGCSDSNSNTYEDKNNSASQDAGTENEDANTQVEGEANTETDNKANTETDTNTEAENEPVIPPDFELEDLEGNKVKLSSLKGKKVILNFWATWCGFCVKEMPDLEKLQATYKDDLVVVYVNVGETKEKAQEFVDNNGLTGLVLLDMDSAVAGTYGIEGFPTTFGINADGTAQNYYVGAMEYDLMEAMYSELK